MSGRFGQRIRRWLVLFEFSVAPRWVACRRSSVAFSFFWPTVVASSDVGLTVGGAQTNEVYLYDISDCDTDMLARCMFYSDTAVCNVK